MKHKTQEWTPLAAGGFNEVYVNAKAGLVFKVMHNTEFDTDTPERSVRLWNLLNPTLKPKAAVATIKIDGVKIYGWTCPYVKNQYNKTQESDALSMVKQDAAAFKTALRDPDLRAKEDKNIAQALIDIYNRSGRIIVDAPVVGNFVTTASGQTICVDIGMALLLEKEETACLDRYARRMSIVSNDAWEASHEDMRTRILQNENPVFPETMLMTKALLFIRTYRPDITNADFLKTEAAVTKQLAAAYDSSTGNDIDQAKDLLNLKRPVDLITMKNNCSKVLLDYIHSRGSLDEGQTFTASWKTKLFRSKVQSIRKVDGAQQLLKTINSAQSIQDIQTALQEAGNKPELMKGVKSGFAISLGLCKVFSQIPPSVTPDPQHQFD